MEILEIRLHTLRLPLVTPFTTSFSTQSERTALILELHGKSRDQNGGFRQVVGWGECAALADPVYSPEYTAGARDVLVQYLIPALFRHQLLTGEVNSETVSHVMGSIVGHRMAKSALEMALLDAELRARGDSFGTYLGATADRVPSGVSVGIQESIPDLLDVVSGYLEQGYVRIKLKIRPGWDVAAVRAVREHFGYELPLQVDANTAYTLGDAPLLRQLDAFNLLLIEQPLGEADIRQHAELARRISTPVCLDESITSAEAAADAISMRAAAVINIKPGRVGGYIEARRIHDLARAHGTPVWCGGMLETGLGRAANVALAAMPGFTLPGDISASNRFYASDVTEPLVIKDGHIEVPTRPGLGVEPIPEMLQAFSVSRTVVRPEGSTEPTFA
jgi:O-succinylbenzoate synthase